MAGMALEIGTITHKYEFRVVVRSGLGLKIPRKSKRVWRRGPQEAIEYAQELLRIPGHINKESFRLHGGVCIKKIHRRVCENGRVKEKSEVVFPF